MCTIPPPPPPPTDSSNWKPSLNSYNDTEISSSSDICKWAVHESQLWEACVNNSICLDQAPYQYTYKHFDSILQVGPTCGLVALSMLLNGNVSSDELLNIARIEGFSNNGEMFSCNNMAKLAEKSISLVEKENIQFHVKQGGLYSEEIIMALLNGAVLMVAYDADFNHSPCQRKGHTAHWALICGVIIISEPKGGYTLDSNNVIVLCRHGKSKHLSAWDLELLDKSNKNLWEFSPKKKEDGILYVLPEGGIGGSNGLRDQFLIFYEYIKKHLEVLPKFRWATFTFSESNSEVSVDMCYETLLNIHLFVKSQALRALFPATQWTRYPWSDPM